MVKETAPRNVRPASRNNSIVQHNSVLHVEGSPTSLSHNEDTKRAFLSFVAET